MLAELVDAVVGVDTHRDTHHVEIALPTGAPIATCSYGVGLTRAVGAAGLPVLECEQPTRKTRRGRGKSDPIDAHLAVLTALRLDVDRLPTPRADGDREALRILLGARHDLTTAVTAQTNRLRALLRDGDDTDRRPARSALTNTALAGPARRRAPHTAPREHLVRHGEVGQRWTVLTRVEDVSTEESQRRWAAWAAENP